MVVSGIELFECETTRSFMFGARRLIVAIGFGLRKQTVQIKRESAGIKIYQIRRGPSILGNEG